MTTDQSTCITISDFNLSNLNGYLANDPDPPAIIVIEAPYGQIAQVLLSTDPGFWTPQPDLAIVWTRPQAVVESFRRLLEGEPVSVDAVLTDVDEYARLLLGLGDRVQFAFVPSWVLSPQRRFFPTLAMKKDIGVDNVLMRMNVRLAEALDNAPGFHLLNAQNWITLAGRASFNPKLWYLSKIPYSNQVFKEAVATIKASLRGLTGRSKKLILLDLDNTLWGGIVGELGWQQLRLGGHDPIGESFLDFQTALKSLSNRGILLGIVSRNDEAVALDALRSHPEMVLRLEDFVGWRINWGDKAQNVADLVDSLNLGLEATVFIDDDPVERARVREALPDVLVPEWPQDPTQYCNTLLSLTCFDSSIVTEEDRDRTRMYVAERERTSGQPDFDSLDQWLRTLNIVATCESLAPVNLSRASQLLNKTNQMNLSTRRMSESEFLEWSNAAGRSVRVFRLTDRFGDLGITGLISLEANGNVGRIVDFVLSCRVMGRKLEETMLSAIIKDARSLGLDEVYARHLPTAKNGPCLQFWQRSNFGQEEDGHTFRWDTTRPYPLPEQIQLKVFAEPRLESRVVRGKVVPSIETSE